MKSTEPLARSLTQAIQTGELEALKRLLDANPAVARARIVDPKGVSRTLLHVAADWPGHFPEVGRTIRLLLEYGADPEAPLEGGNAPERPLHGAASSDDVEALAALLDGGANIESPGAIFTDGAAMSDAVIFAQWNAARLLLARGAKTTFTQSAALGLMDRLTAHFEESPAPDPASITAAFWHACRGGQLEAAHYLAAKGANKDWIGWDHLTPLDAAEKNEDPAVAIWLRSQGAKRGRD